MLAYNLLKYYIVLLRNFRQFMCSQALKDKHPQLNWDDFWKTKEFKEICKETEEDLVKYETKFDSLYDQCEGIIARIEAVNPKFIAAYHREITESGF